MVDRHNITVTRPESDGLRNAWADALTRLKSLCES